MRRCCLLVMFIAACGSEAPDRALPGPCRAGDATYAYDDLDRRTSIHYRYEDGEGDASDWTVTWTYADDGAVASIAMEGGSSVDGSENATWTFSATAVLLDAYNFLGHYEDATYEPTLAFLGDPHEVNALLDLDAPDAIVRGQNGNDPAVDFTYDGPPHQGTRTRTGSDGSIATFTYDADGRLLEWDDDGEVTSFVYQDGELAEKHRLTYTELLEHDEFGNLLRTEGGWDGNSSVVTTYDYGCW